MRRSALCWLAFAVGSALAGDWDIPAEWRGAVRYLVDKSGRLAIVVDDADFGGERGKADGLLLFTQSGPIPSLPTATIADARITFAERTLRIVAADGSQALELALGPLVPQVEAREIHRWADGIELVYYPLSGNEPLAAFTSTRFGGGPSGGWRSKPEDIDADGGPGEIQCSSSCGSREAACAVACAASHYPACSCNPRYGAKRCVCIAETAGQLLPVHR
jgi:hypothetical protein